MTTTDTILDAIGDYSASPDAVRCNHGRPVLSVRLVPGAVVDDETELTPAEWCRVTGVRILDPDGWRGDGGRDWAEPVTLIEFQERAGRSTREMPVYRPNRDQTEETST